MNYERSKNGDISQIKSPGWTVCVLDNMSEEVKSQLVNVGFHPRHVDKAFVALKNHDFEQTLEWLLTNAPSDKDRFEFLLEDVMAMGFTKDDAKAALNASNMDMQRALAWLSDRDTALQKKLQVQRDLQIKAENELHNLKIQRRRSSEQKEFVSFEAPPPEPGRLFPPYVSFGGCIALQNVQTKKFLFSEHGKTTIYATVEEYELGDCKDAVFEIHDAVNPKNTAKVERAGVIPVALKGSDGNWISAEIDGRVNTNRSGAAGLFASWKIRVLKRASEGKNDENDEDDPSYNDGVVDLQHMDIVSLESALHNLLHIKQEDDEVVAEMKATPVPPKKAKWFVHILKSDPEIDMSMTMRSGRRKSIHSLWRALRSNYRLAALKMRNDEVKHHQDEVERHKKRLVANVEDQVEECIICWTNARNTVLLECGHIALCTDCTDAVKVNDAEHGCPVCRKKVTRIIQIRED
jgi:hypothetical protein